MPVTWRSNEIITPALDHREHLQSKNSPGQYSSDSYTTLHKLTPIDSMRPSMRLSCDVRSPMVESPRLGGKGPTSLALLADVRPYRDH